MTTDSFPISKKSFNLAEAFRISADIILDSISKSCNNAPPAEACCVIVNYCFAVELYLKSLLHNENKEKKHHNHDLLILFSNLSDEKKIKIKEQPVIQNPEYGIDSHIEFDIEKTLEEHKNSFTEFRYLFEPKNSEVKNSIIGIRMACDILASFSKSVIFDSKSA